MNKTFQKAVLLLSRPVSLLALVLLFLNDHVLRVLWPSWITGKLGDFAWLFFAPFALAAVLALLIPASVRKHEKLVGLLAFGIVGFFFFLENSFPSANRFMIAVLEWLLPFRVQIVRDPTDLFALLSFVPSWLLWKKEERQPAVSNAKGFALISVAVCLTVANAPAPPLGIECLLVKEEGVIAVSSYDEGFLSEDGGFSWEFIEDTNFYCEFHSNAEDAENLVADPDNVNRLFRMNRKQQIEMSENGGQTWKIVPDILILSKYVTKKAYKLDYVYPMQQAIRDPETRNLIFPLGLNGVLLENPSGKWYQVRVGDYGR